MDYRKSIDPNNKTKKYLRKLEEEVFLPLYEVTEVSLYNYHDGTVSAVKIGTEIQGRNEYYRLIKEIEVPSRCNSKFPAIKVDFGKTMGGFNGGFESLLSINGERLCAVDTYHNCIRIPDMYHGQTVQLEFEIWTGFEGGGSPQILIHTLNQFSVGYEDEITRELLLHFQAISEVYELQSSTSELALSYRKLLSKFNLDVEQNNDREAMLNEIVLHISKLDKTTEVELLMFGHAHIDLAWLWTLENGREKTVRTLSTVINHAREYEQYKYIHSSPQIFAYLKIHHQELFDQIVELVDLGQIEIEGGMWVEADCNLPSGESLSKQLLHGKRFISDNFGYESKVLWLPDVFGYSWAMPQLMKKAGINTFMTTKISWNKFNKMPTETFNWKGIDGTEVLTHFMTTPEPNSQHWNKTYTAEIKADLLERTWTTYEDQLINNKLPVAYGYGDGGGGPTREMIELIDIYDKLPGVPKLSHATLAESANILHSSVDQHRISSWDGELYLEYHRGTFTTQGLIKKYNKRAELQLKQLETIITLTGNAQLNEQLKNIWQVMLLYQFHDILPGSSLYEANIGVIEEYHQLFDNIKQLTNSCVQESLSPHVFNYHSNHATNLIAEYVSDIPNQEFISEGVKLVSYYFDNRYFIDIPSLAPHESLELQIEMKKQVKPKQVPANTLLKTQSYTIGFDQNGTITTLIDAQTGRSVIGQYANKLVIYDDYPQNFDAWDFDIDYRESVYQPELITTCIIEDNKEVTIIVNEYKFNLSTISEQIVIKHQGHQLIFNHQVDWQETNKFLRSLTSSGIRSSKYTCGTQFGQIERKNNSNTSWELAQFEICGHNFIDLSQADRGLAILSDYKYGYNCIGDLLGISLLRSPKYPDHLADMGTHTYSYNIVPHRGDFKNGVYDMAFKNAERLTVANYKVPVLTSCIDGIDLNNSSFEISSIAPSFNGQSTIIRVVEIRGGDANLLIKDKTIVREVTIDEKPLATFIGNSIEFKPYEVKTLEVSYE